MRGSGVDVAALEIGASVWGREGVDAENVGRLTLNVDEEPIATVGFLGVTANASVENLEGVCATDFGVGGSIPKVGGGRRASDVGVRGEKGARGETERDCDRDPGGGIVAIRVGRVPLGVLTVRGRGLSRSEDLLRIGEVTCSTCRM